MTAHIDQLTAWWENAEKGTPREGDTYIARFPGRDGYETGVVDSDGLPEGMLPDTRILARAPKPKPAWHEADYVIARADGKSRRVWANNRFMKRWEDGVSWSHADDLRDVTPLIEAKVTDEMVDLAWSASKGWEFGGVSKPAARAMLTAALGLETT